MASLRNLSPQQNKTLEYFDKYDYPLTGEELEFWSSVKVSKYKSINGYFYLPSRKSLIKLRTQREKYSLLKWGIAYKQAAKLTKIPFVEAIFVTGSLAMSNCKKTDDIDLMIITSPNTLWITRFVVNIILFKSRRFPNVKSAPDKICTNLWLDTRNLKIPERSLYHAHEILQTKCIFDRGGVQYQFLRQNFWVKDYLPTAYKFQIKNSKTQINTKSQVSNFNFMIYLVIRILNLGFFVLQYLYMLPKKSTEKVGLGFAFFHPIKK